MKLKWILTGLLVSIAIHLLIMLALGKIELKLPSFDFIDTYIFEKKKTVKQEKQIENQKIEKKQSAEHTEQPQDNNLNENLKQEDSNAPQISQTGQENDAQVTKTNFNPFTRFINEKMKFDIYWSGIYVGSAQIEVKGNESEVTITSTVKSAGFISNFYYVNDWAESKIELGKPKHFRVIQIEGKHKGNKETLFNYEKGEIVFINHIKNKLTSHKGVDKIFMDVLSGFFYLRTFPINLNETVKIDIFDSDKFATVEVVPIKEETLELSNNQKIDAILIKPLLETEGLFKRKGDIFIWLTKDDKKIPLKVETKVSFGRVVAELREYKKE